MIEHQSSVDYKMPYRILNYCIEIIRNAIDKKKLGTKNYKMPIVYTIVLYTGKTKWNPKSYFQECQTRLKGAEAQEFASYSLIDINDYTEEELWKENNFLSKMLLLEKAKVNKKIPEYINKIVKEKLDESQIDIIIQMIYNSLDKKLGKSAIIDLMNKMKERDGGNNMCALEEYLDSLFDQGMERGIEQGSNQKKKEIVIRMLQNNMEENTIKLMTQITEKELEAIKKEIQILSN